MEYLDNRPRIPAKIKSITPTTGRAKQPIVRINFEQFDAPAYLRGRLVKFASDLHVGDWWIVSTRLRAEDPSFWSEAYLVEPTQEPETVNPTQEQLAIGEAAKGTANLMIKALAGTGKTTTISTQVVPNLPPTTSSILALAFNKKIQEELKARLPVRMPWGAELKVQTLNGMGHGAWWSFTKRSDLQVDGRKSTNLLKLVCADMNVSLSKEEFGAVNDLVAAAKALGFVPNGISLRTYPVFKDNEEGIEAVFDWAEVDWRHDLEVLFRAALQRSINECLRNGLMDFNDQIYMPIIFGAPFRKFHTVIVDEAQDLSDLNHRMILKAVGSRLIVVGDENQAIYAFRGALSDSMDRLRASREFVELPLTMTFRCAKAIVARAQAYVPEYIAAPGNPEGIVEEWPIDLTIDDENRSGQSWSKGDVPNHSAIICRNNAPLISLAFKFLRQGRGVRMLGSDIGRSLERALEQACKRMAPDTASPQVAVAVDVYFNKELAKAKTDRKKDSLQDRWECVRAIVDNSATLREAKATCHKLFENPDAVVTLSSGHKAKGLEWDTVIHLDPFRIPSRFATGPEALKQEYNLRYVIETRAKTRLILANLEDFR